MKYFLEIYLYIYLWREKLKRKEKCISFAIFPSFHEIFRVGTLDTVRIIPLVQDGSRAPTSKHTLIHDCVPGNRIEWPDWQYFHSLSTCMLWKVKSASCCNTPTGPHPDSHRCSFPQNPFGWQDGRGKHGLCTPCKPRTGDALFGGAQWIASVARLPPRSPQRLWSEWSSYTVAQPCPMWPTSGTLEWCLAVLSQCPDISLEGAFQPDTSHMPYQHNIRGPLQTESLPPGRNLDGRGVTKDQHFREIWWDWMK